MTLTHKVFKCYILRTYSFFLHMNNISIYFTNNSSLSNVLKDSQLIETH